MSRTGKLLILAKILRELEEDHSFFTPLEVAEKTGYAASSITKYISEKLKGKFVFEQDGKLYVKGISVLSDDDFFNLMRQSTNEAELTPEQKIYQKLVSRSRDAFTLALELYNRPSLTNRVESFAIMMVNAWELLLKAEILKTDGHAAVFYKNGNSLAIKDALVKRLQENDPAKINLDTLIELRDQAVHLLIPELQPQLSRLFQANVLNFQTRYRNEMGASPLAGQSVGMLSLVIDGPSAEVAVIKKEYGTQTAKLVEKFLSNFTEKSKYLDSKEYAIPMDYQLRLVNRAYDSDLELSIGDGSKEAVIIQKAKDPNITHPYYQSQAIHELNKRQTQIKVTSYNFQAVLKKHKIKKSRNSEMHYELDGRHRYSEAFIHWFLKNLKQPNWMKQALAQ